MDVAGFIDSVRAEDAGWDRRAELPADVIRTMAGLGLLIPDLPPRYGGSGGTAHQLGEVCAQLGEVCASLRGLVTVQSMVAAALVRWGTVAQQERWLPALAAGEQVVGFAATEPEAGSDLAAVQTQIEIESGLAYNWHRHYDPTTGRYTQPDPMGFIDGPSRYAYALSSPGMYDDFSGLQRGRRGQAYSPTPAQNLQSTIHRHLRNKIWRLDPKFTEMSSGSGNPPSLKYINSMYTCSPYIIYIFTTH